MSLARWAWVGALGVAFACGGQMSVIGRDEQPQNAGNRVAPQTHAHNDSTIELPDDEQIVEPSQPAVGSTQERALAHVHTPKATCSGVVLGSRVVVTAHQCVGEATGVGVVTPSAKFFVEVATSGMTWTKRQVATFVTPGCGWEKLDLAVLVLTDNVEWVKPLRVTTSPPPGGKMQALGFGRCAGETRGLSNRVGELLRREGDALVVDLALCRGDIGGPLVEPTSGDVYGIISHQDDPDNATRRTTTVVRLDTSPARALVAQAASLASGADRGKLDAVACQ
jgi:hypothetical protein